MKKAELDRSRYRKEFEALTPVAQCDKTRAASSSLSNNSTLTPEDLDIRSAGDEFRSRYHSARSSLGASVNSISFPQGMNVVSPLTDTEIADFADEGGFNDTFGVTETEWRHDIDESTFSSFLKRFVYLFLNIFNNF